MRSSMRFALLLALLFLAACQPAPPPLPRPPERPGSDRPNIILIYTDDQRWDALCPTPGDMDGLCGDPQQQPMPVTMALAAEAVVFTNAFLTNPLCCPSRASLLAGGLYSHHTGIMSNKHPQGGAELFAQLDSDTIATRLQAAGYLTAWSGNKYLNGYNHMVVPQAGTAYIPPGWNRFAPAYNPDAGDWLDTFEVVVHDDLAGEPTTRVETVSGPDEPDLITWERAQVEDFIGDVCPTSDPAGCAAPFFVLWSTWAPHFPALVPAEYAGFYTGYTYTGRAYYEADRDGLADKPYHVQVGHTTFDRAWAQGKIRSQLRQMRWLDDEIRVLLQTLEAKGLVENTIILFTSDNGFQWGEHSIMHKSKPYEESLHVPLFIRHPAWEPGTIRQMVAVDLDLAPTILELAGAEAMPTDGESLLGLVADPSLPWRDVLLIQGGYLMDDYTYPRAWVGVRRADGWKYVEYVTGERELYRLTTDPYERYNRYDTPGFGPARVALQEALATFDLPLAITTEALPDPTTNLLPPATTGAAYTFSFGARGGTPPYSWAAYWRDLDPRCAGELPPGLTLSTEGLLQGTPQTAGVYDFCVQVRGAGGGVLPQADYRRFTLSVAPE